MVGASRLERCSVNALKVSDEALRDYRRVLRNTCIAFIVPYVEISMKYKPVIATIF
jgi:hypothetical protein